MHVYTLSHHHQAINKLNNNSNKENLFNENRRFQQQQQQHHQFNNAHMHQIQTKITPRLPDSVNSYNPNIYMHIHTAIYIVMYKLYKFKVP